jgi:cupin superfamily acireductone dioxygenase involved in methionine salvage
MISTKPRDTEGKMAPSTFEDEYDEIKNEIVKIKLKHRTDKDILNAYNSLTVLRTKITSTHGSTASDSNNKRKLFLKEHLDDDEEIKLIMISYSEFLSSEVNIMDEEDSVKNRPKILEITMKKSRKSKQTGSRTTFLESAAEKAIAKGAVKRKQSFLIKTRQSAPSANLLSTLQESPQKMDALLKLAEQAKYCLKEHLADLASKHMKEYLSLSSSLTESQKSQLPNTTQLFSEINMINENIATYMRLFDEEEGWILESSKGELSVKYQILEGGLIGLKMEGIINVPLFNLITVINEPDAYASWVPFCKKGVDIKQLTKASKACYCKIGCPIPLDDRDIYLVGVGIDRLDVNGSLLILANSYDDDPAFLEKHQLTVPPPNKGVRVKTRYLGSEITPISRNKLKFRMLSHADMKFNFMPKAVLNWFVRKFAMGLFEKLIDTAKNMKAGVFDNYLKDPNKAEFYSWLNQRVDQFFEQNNTVITEVIKPSL